MRKLVAAIYGEKAAEGVVKVFEGLNDEQRYELMMGIADAINSVLEHCNYERIDDDEMRINLESSCERLTELIPSYAQKIREETDAQLAELCPPIRSTGVSEEDTEKAAETEDSH